MFILVFVLVTNVAYMLTTALHLPVTLLQIDAVVLGLALIIWIVRSRKGKLHHD